MGLNTSHNAWHGPYISFNQFRYWLASLIGINLKEYIGYGINGTKDLKTINNDLRILFDHSDCDGNISPKDCKKIADAITKILKKVNKDSDFITKMHYDEAITFRDGCLLAHSKNEVLDFH